MSSRTRHCLLCTCIAAFALLSVGALAGCGGEAIDRSAEIQQLWASDPASADWDMTIRDVVAGEMSTGEHMASGTIYLTTYTSKTVPGFAVYQTLGVFNNDTMDFENRVTANFNTLSGGSYFPMVQDVKGFMEWYAANMQGKYFLRLKSNTDGAGNTTWDLVVSDVEPTSWTMNPDFPSTLIPLAFDQGTGAWSAQ